MIKIAGSGGLLVGYTLSVSERPVFNDLLVSAGNIDAVNVQFLDWEEQTHEQQQKSVQLQRFRWALLENLYFQYDLGLISEAVWKRTQVSIKRHYGRCELRDAMELSLSNPAFQEYVTSFSDNCAR